jgi:hypothetical protein
MVFSFFEIETCERNMRQASVGISDAPARPLLCFLRPLGSKSNICNVKTIKVIISANNSSRHRFSLHSGLCDYLGMYHLHFGEAMNVLTTWSGSHDLDNMRRAISFQIPRKRHGIVDGIELVSLNRDYARIGLH